MKRILSLLIVTIFLLLSYSIAHAQNKSNEEIATLKNKLEMLSNKFDQYDKNFERITSNQNNAIIAIILIAAILVGASIFNNVYLIKNSINHVKTDLRKDIAGKLRKLKGELTEFIELKLKKSDENLSFKFDNLLAISYDSLGRIYFKTIPFSSALWFARSLPLSIKLNFGEEWINIQIDNIIEGLATNKVLWDAESVKDFDAAIKSIPKDKFTAKRAKLKKMFENKLNIQQTKNS